MSTESILATIKEMLGISTSDTGYDTDVINDINAVLSNLVQMGIGPEDGFFITDATSKWSDFISDSSLLGQVESYVYIKVKLMFDPPENKTLIDSMNKVASECEWRMYVQKGGY